MIPTRRSLPIARGSASRPRSPSCACSASPTTVAPALAPAGLVVPSLPWSMLSRAERQALYGASVDRVLDAGLSPMLRPAGDPTPAEDPPPDWARAAGITPTTWAGMNTTAREAARQQHVAASNVGWTVAGTVIQQGSAIVQSILGGNLQRDLAAIQASASTSVAQTQADAARFVAETNRQIADLNLAAAQATAGGNAPQAAQFQQAIQALQAAQNGQTNALAQALQGLQQRSAQGMSTTAKIGLGLGAAVVLGGVAYLAFRPR